VLGGRHRQDSDRRPRPAAPSRALFRANAYFYVANAAPYIGGTAIIKLEACEYERQIEGLSGGTRAERISGTSSPATAT
jgi:hypothetical protein